MGRLLVAHVQSEARAAGLDRVKAVSHPPAEDFCHRPGARHLPWRTVRPVLEETSCTLSCFPAMSRARLEQAVPHGRSSPSFRAGGWRALASGFRYAVIAL